jgi:polyhydroxyalkanoate synthesis regulator phasin
MGRKKNTELTDKPVNVRLSKEGYQGIKEIARREGAFESDVHRELVDEALRARREKADVVAGEAPTGCVAETLERIEKVLAELARSGVLSLPEEVQALTSRVAYLSDQIALLTSPPPKRQRPRDKQEGTLFS